MESITLDNLSYDMINIQDLDISKIISHLTIKEAFVLRETVIIGHTEKDVSIKLSISQQGVHKIKKRALQKLFKLLMEVKQ